MTASPVTADRLLYLADTVCNDTACRAELEELDAILVGSGVSRQLYFDYCRMHVFLGMELDAQWAAERACERIRSDANAIAFVDTVALGCPPQSDVHISSPAPTFPATLFQSAVGYSSSGWPLAYLIATVIFSIGLTICAVVHVSQPVEVASTHSTSPASPDDLLQAPVARISAIIDCQWGKGSVPLRVDGTVTAGREIKLESGLMEITYDSGAKVILQGPVAYVVESRNGGFMSVGKLTGKVTTERARGFAVRTPTATVIDLGTEFGVEVDRFGQTETHVFLGTVRIVRCKRESEAKEARVLQAGQMARCNRNQVIIVEAGPLNVDRFVRQLSWEPMRLEERFTGKGLSAGFQQTPTGRYVNIGGAGVYQGPPHTRGYIHTVTTDFIERDSVFEAEFHVDLNSPKRDSRNRIYFGIGDGSPNAAYWNEPSHGLFLTLVLDSGKAFVQSATPGASVTAMENILQVVAPQGSIGTGTHRLRMRKAGMRVWFAIDSAASGPFQADFTSSSFELPASAPGLDASNSRLMIGTGNYGDMTVHFKRLLVTYCDNPRSEGGIPK